MDHLKQANFRSSGFVVHSSFLDRARLLRFACAKGIVLPTRDAGYFSDKRRHPSAEVLFFQIADNAAGDRWTRDNPSWPE
jgi:hypothetical protein